MVICIYVHEKKGSGGWEKSVSLAADCAHGAEEAEAKRDSSTEVKDFMAIRDVVTWAGEPRLGPE